MKNGFKNVSCTNDYASTSTSTLHHHHTSPTLEEMIMQLDLEASTPTFHNRMSCVNSSDILRTARNALSQYPRFSLDGKDAMYQSSFRSFDHRHLTTTTRPSILAGERVIWCNPGVIAKLMGLEAMPIPVRLKHSRMMMNTCLLANHTEKRKVDSRRSRDSCSKATTSKRSLRQFLEVLDHK